MGGDDLGSDDEYLKASISDDDNDEYHDGIHRNNKNGSIVGLDREDSENENSHASGSKKKTKKKRKRSNEIDDDLNNVQNERTDNDSVKKLNEAPSNNNKLVIELGRSIERQSLENQSKFLRTVVLHYNTLFNSMNENDINNKEPLDKNVLLPSHFLKATTTKPKEIVTYSDKLRGINNPSIVSMKKLKNWKPLRSPMVLIICLSARRAVEIIKEISTGGMKIRIAKLFAKHIPIEQQEQMLRTQSFSIAVGTPHRLKMLSSTPQDSNSSNSDNRKKYSVRSPLSMEHTQLVVLDSHLNSKEYMVSTLPDTAPHVSEYINDYVLPQLKRRKNIKLSFF